MQRHIKTRKQGSAGYLVLSKSEKKKNQHKEETKLVYFTSMFKIPGKGRNQRGENMYNIYYFIKYVCTYYFINF